MDTQPRVGRLALFLAMVSSAALLAAWASGHGIGMVEALAGLAVAGAIWMVETHPRPVRAPVVQPLSRSQRRVVLIDAPQARALRTGSDLH